MRGGEGCLVPPVSVDIPAVGGGVAVGFLTVSCGFRRTQQVLPSWEPRNRRLPGHHHLLGFTQAVLANTVLAARLERVLFESTGGLLGEKH